VSVAIKIENLSKIYHLGQIGTGTFYNDLKRFSAKLRGKEDPFLKIGESNDRSTKGGNVVYSLKDINLEINQGDAVGIIGKNGAGKSTLLKLISQITAPTSGQIKIKGRVASLLEVGTGFHPELTGRENIYLNGAILGMRKSEISRKMDEIIDFSGVERYIDTPVKRYSSGMYVRLAFAVAAHLESEILIIDEVLAVGDSEFQKKCLGKMGDISKGEGRTVLFVSHNLDSISKLCQKGVLLEHGKLLEANEMSKVLNRYMKIESFSYAKKFEYFGLKPQIISVSLNSNLLVANKFQLIIKFKSPFLVSQLVPGFVVYNQLNVPIFGSNTRFHKCEINYSSILEGEMIAEIEELNLHSGNYSISVWLGDQLVDFDEKVEVIQFEYKSKNNYQQLPNPLEIGSVDQVVNWC
jgi:lipopolysaccharide transport system ATP-binding protein